MDKREVHERNGVAYKILIDLEDRLHDIIHINGRKMNNALNEYSGKR